MKAFQGIGDTMEDEASLSITPKNAHSIESLYSTNEGFSRYWRYNRR
jgi:hypothetical protein